MFPDLFSKRYSLRPTPAGLIHEEMPKSARIGLYHIIERHFDEWQQEDNHVYRRLYRNICEAFRIPRDRTVEWEQQASPAIETIINSCNWWSYCDICEIVWKSLSSRKYKPDATIFSDEINQLFQEERLGFELREGKIEKIGSGFIDAKIQEVRYLLKEPEFKGADTLFEKAIKALNTRPKPDTENCIKDAVGAIESIGRILIGDEKALLDDIIKDATNKGIIPKPLDQTFTKLYAYRGSEPGVAHGTVGALTDKEDEAELVLAMSAAMIMYLIKKKNLK